MNKDVKRVRFRKHNASLQLEYIARDIDFCQLHLELFSVGRNTPSQQKKKLKKGWVKHTRRMNMDAKAVKCRVNATNLLQKKKNYSLTHHSLAHQEN
jgi:hypothetical protein